MITVDEAREAVDRRLAALVPAGAGLLEAGDLGLSCSGTDVRGPDLLEELRCCRAEVALCLCRGDDLATVLNGMLLRTFWLGYAFGEASE